MSSVDPQSNPGFSRTLALRALSGRSAKKGFCAQVSLENTELKVQPVSFFQSLSEPFIRS